MTTVVKGYPVHVRDLAQLSMEKLWKLNGVYDVTFDDGVVLNLPSRYIKISWPYWGLTRVNHEVKIPSTLTYKPGDVARDRHHLEFMTQASLLAQDVNMPLEKIRWSLLKDVYSVAYNNTVGNLKRYVTTMDYDDFFQVYEHPSVQEAYKIMQMYPTGKNNDGEDMANVAFNLIEEAFKDPIFAENEFIESIRNESLSTNNGLQAYLRGPLSEINSTIYDIQGPYGFFGGLLNLSTIAKESVATSRSHLFNKDNIADAEYGSRKYQLISNVIMRHFRDDCETPHSHKHTFVDSKLERERFKSMVGMSYRLEGSKGEWLHIKKNGFDEIVNKPIEFRTAMCCVRLRDQGVCQTCLGRLYRNLSRKASPGHVAAVTVASKGSQGILSTKHLDFLRRLEELLIPPAMGEFIEKFKHKTIKGVKLRSKFRRQGWNKATTYIELSESEHSEIAQMRWSKNLMGLDDSSMSELQTLTLLSIPDGEEVLDYVTFNMRMGTCGNFSKDFIKYCLDVHPRIQSRGKTYLVPLDKWDTNKLFVSYSNRSESMAEFVSALESKIRSVSSNTGEERIIKGNSDELLKRGGRTYNLVEFGGATEESCTAALFDLQQFINRKLKNVNMAHLGVLLAASRVESYTNPYPAVGFDPEGSNTGKRFLDHNTLIGIRSAVPMLFFEKQRAYKESLQFYTDRERPESVYDTALVIPPGYRD